MRHEIINKRLVFFLEGELNSYNAEQVEKEIDETIAKGGFETVGFDADKLRYMSSAGLRIVAKLKQEYDDFSIVNMSDDVYDVFVMVGFADLIDIKRK